MTAEGDGPDAESGAGSKPTATRDATSERDGDAERRRDAGSGGDDATDGGTLPDPRSGPIAALRWFWHTDDSTVAFVREVGSSIGAVLLVGLLLFAISGVWPPMVAVESGSMEPNMYRGDLVFLMDEHRFPPGAAQGDTGVVTYQEGRENGYRKVGDYGDVVVFAAGSQAGPPIIHRVRFWVDEGENWYQRADDSYLEPGDESCQDLSNCPAPHAGFITKGDANSHYDQANGISEPVRPGWIRGTAELRIPWLGHVRLFLSESTITGVPPSTITGVPPSTDSVAPLSTDSVAPPSADTSAPPPTISHVRVSPAIR